MAMTRIAEDERQILVAVRAIERRPCDSAKGKNRVADKETLLEEGERWFEEKLEDWTSAFDSLIEKGLLNLDGPVYRLTDMGKPHAEREFKKQVARDFGDLYVKFAGSKTYSVFCERVFGMDLCQLNAADMPQLHELIDALDLSADHYVLDLGCGVGKTSEYISDGTEARILGIDLAPAAIAHARDRTREKRHRMEFREMDMDAIALDPATFDCVVAVDTLYFVEDLEQTIGQLKRLLKPHGQMGIFYSESLRSPDESPELLEPDNTRLAQAMKQHALSFRTREFTDRERDLWQKHAEVAEDLKTEFEAEGNLEIYECRIGEARRVLERLDARKCRRYLYHVQARE